MIWRGWALPPTAPSRRSTRASAAPIYAQYFEELARRGLVYPCFCSRSQLHAASAPHRSDGQVVYAGTCRSLTPAEIAERAKTRAPAWRVRVPDEVIAFEDGHMGPCAENLARDCGDFYLRRADGVFAYQLAVVVDDALMGVNEVVRGSDLLSSTARQLWLYRELGLRAPQFYHLPLLLASDGRRLSKRDGDQSLEHLRARYSPEEIIGRLAFACGLQNRPTPATPQESGPHLRLGQRCRKTTSFCRKGCFNGSSPQWLPPTGARRRVSKRNRRRRLLSAETEAAAKPTRAGPATAARNRQAAHLPLIRRFAATFPR